MKKLKKLEPLKPFEINGTNVLGGIKRGDKYWDTHPEIDGVVADDHECPNGNILFKDI